MTTAKKILFGFLLTLGIGALIASAVCTGHLVATEGLASATQQNAPVFAALLGALSSTLATVLGLFNSLMNSRAQHSLETRRIEAAAEIERKRSEVTAELEGKKMEATGQLEQKKMEFSAFLTKLKATFEADIALEVGRLKDRQVALDQLRERSAAVYRGLERMVTTQYLSAEAETMESHLVDSEVAALGLGESILDAFRQFQQPAFNVLDSLRQKEPPAKVWKTFGHELGHAFADVQEAISAATARQRQLPRETAP